MTKPEFVALALILLRENGIMRPSGMWLDRAWEEYTTRQSFGNVGHAAGLLNAVALSLNNSARVCGVYIPNGQVDPLVF